MGHFVRSLVRQGDFLTFIARHWIDDAVRRGEFCVLDVPETPVRRKAGLLYRQMPHRRTAVNAFMDGIGGSCSTRDSS